MSGPSPGRGRAPSDPFWSLGLPAKSAVTDDDVRSAWRRIAAATHPDRTDGGDPARFAAASAAYTILRTPSGRGEALAGLTDLAARRTGVLAAPRESVAARDLVPGIAGDVAPRAAARALPRRAGTAGPIARAAARVLRGRPAVLAARVLIVAAVGAVAAALTGSGPATPALITGVVTWFVLTARHDLAPPR